MSGGSIRSNNVRKTKASCDASALVIMSVGVDADSLLVGVGSVNSPLIGGWKDCLVEAVN